MRIIFISMLMAFSSYINADFLSGKIVMTEGHFVPDCRTITLEIEDESGVYRKNFRIKHSDGDDINSVALAAMIANKQVRVAFKPGEGSGCGDEDMVRYISIFND